MNEKIELPIQSLKTSSKKKKTAPLILVSQISVKRLIEMLSQELDLPEHLEFYQLAVSNKNNKSEFASGDLHESLHLSFVIKRNKN